MAEEEEAAPAAASPQRVSSPAVGQTVTEAELDGFSAVGKKGRTVTAVAAAPKEENIFVRLREVLENRGKKVTRC